MKKEYDFTNAEQGKFSRPIEMLDVPVYLDKEIMDVLVSRVQASGLSLSEIVNSLIRKDIEISQKLAL